MGSEQGDPAPETLRRGRSLHLDHYGGERLPYSCVEADGIRQRLARVGPDAEGEVTVLDASCAYASTPFGAGPPGVSQRVADALETSVSPVTDEVGAAERARFLDRLFGPDGLWADRFPGDEYHVSGRNSGSEGMELALRLVLESRFDRETLRPTDERGDRDRILAFEGAWHGWTQGVRPLVDRRHYTVGLPGFPAGGRFPVEVDTLPFGDREALEAYLDEHGGDLLAVVLEPIQGDAGVLLPPEGYLREVAERCSERGALVVADEVMTFAKTGRYFAMTDDRGPIPTDVTVVGKFVGMGVLSTSLVVARRELDVRGSGAVSTSDLRPLTCEVMDAGIDYIEGEGLLQRSAKLGRRLREDLQADVVEAFPDVFREVRGEGILTGLEVTEAHSGSVREIREALIENGVYVEFMAGAGNRSGDHRFVFPTMRVIPPLDVTADQVDEIGDAIAAGVRDYASSGDGARG